MSEPAKARPLGWDFDDNPFTRLACWIRSAFAQNRVCIECNEHFDRHASKLTALADLSPTGQAQGLMADSEAGGLKLWWDTRDVYYQARRQGQAERSANTISETAAEARMRARELGEADDRPTLDAAVSLIMEIDSHDDGSADREWSDRVLPKVEKVTAVLIRLSAAHRFATRRHAKPHNGLPLAAQEATGRRSPSLPADRLMTPQGLANALGVRHRKDAVRSFLSRYATKHPECRATLDCPRTRESRSMYRVAEVWAALVAKLPDWEGSRRDG